MREFEFRFALSKFFSNRAHFFDSWNVDDKQCGRKITNISPDRIKVSQYQARVYEICRHKNRDPGSQKRWWLLRVSSQIGIGHRSQICGVPHYTGQHRSELLGVARYDAVRVSHSFGSRVEFVIAGKGGKAGVSRQAN